MKDRFLFYKDPGKPAWGLYSVTSPMTEEEARQHVKIGVQANPSRTFLIAKAEVVLSAAEPRITEEKFVEHITK